MQISNILQALALMLFVAASSVFPIDSQQISTPCTGSMISSFTPCLNYVSGSTAGGSSTPTSDCCSAVKNLMSTGMDCACLVLTANIPLPLSVNRTLSIGLPRACRMGGVPVQCKASGTPLPAPGPVPFLLTPPPSAASPRGSKASATAPASSQEDDLPLSPDLPPEEPPSQDRIIPVIQPGQPNLACSSAPPSILVLLVAIWASKCC